MLGRLTKSIDTRDVVMVRAVASLIALLLAGNSASHADSIVRDPLLGLSYDPMAIKFESASMDLLRRCPDLESDAWSRTLFLFGKITKDGGDFYIIGGAYLDKKTHVSQVDINGAFLLVNKDSCKLFGPAKEPFEDPLGYSDVLKLEEIESLAKDAATRYVAAFRGKEPLSRAQKRQKINVTNLPSILKKAFELQ